MNSYAMLQSWLDGVLPGTVVPALPRRLLVSWWERFGYNVGAEIGVRQGAFSLALCETIPGLRLRCVDPWQNYTKGMPAYSQDRNYAIAVERLAPYAATLDRRLSMTAVQDVPLGSLDFVYIDANHAYPYVRDDIAAWALRVRSGGMVSGDDYGAPGVKRAVDEYVAAHGITRWWLTDDPSRRNKKGDVFTSWFWFQP